VSHHIYVLYIFKQSDEDWFLFNAKYSTKQRSVSYSWGFLFL